MRLPRYQPAEWVPHEAIWIGWPSSAELWEGYFSGAQQEVGELISTIVFPDPLDKKGQVLRGEHVHLLVRGEEARVAAEAMRLGLQEPAMVTLHEAPMGDIWLRDTGPIFTIVGDGIDPLPRLGATSFGFNGWGGKYNLDYDKDIARIIADLSDTQLSQFSALILEGGALESDGEGTVITTRQCLLNKNRNPAANEKDIEEILRDALGAEKVIWLDEGIVGDHTDGHVDNVARFIAPGRVVCMHPTGRTDPNASIYRDIKQKLENSRDAAGRKIEVIDIPSPGRAVLEKNIVPASHLNFAFTNHSLIMPLYGEITGNEGAALTALEILEREVDRQYFYAIESSNLLSGGGSFHCISQQQPAILRQD